MAHRIHGIITSFKYEGELPHVVLVGNYRFIPTEKASGTRYFETTLEPFKEQTKANRKNLKELSFKGKCAYIETNYFGGPGTQRAEVWYQGERILGPLISFDGINNPKVPATAKAVEDAINETLKAIGTYCHEGKDEFDSMRLGWYRSNEDALEEFENQ